jgi:flagellar hook assembly protein FlgD
MGDLKIRNVRDIVKKIITLTTTFSFILISISGTAVAATETTIERIDLRTENSKTYQTGKNKFTYEETLGKVHFKNARGEYESVDNAIVATKDKNYIFKNNKNDFTFFAGKDLETGVKYEKADKVCEFRLDTIGSLKLNNSKAQKKENKVIYKDIFNGTDLEFTVIAEGIKTEVVTDNDQVLDTDIKFALQNCNVQFNEATIEDEKDLVKVAQDVVNENGTKKLVVKHESKKNLKDRKGKVRIDPSIFEPSINVYTSQYSANGHSRRFLVAGKFYDATTGAYFGRGESYLHFNMSLPGGAIVTDAQLSMRRYANGGNGFTARAGRLTNPIYWNTGQYTNQWQGRTGVYAETWIDSWDNDFRDYRWYITNMAKEWQAGTPNYGIAIFSDNAVDRAGAAFCSSRSDGYCTADKRPKLYIEYIWNSAPYQPSLQMLNYNYAYETLLYSGHCNESVSPATGTCRGSVPVGLRISNMGDTNWEYPFNYRESYYYVHRDGVHIWTGGPITNTWSIDHYPWFTDGSYTINALSYDNVWAQSTHSNTVGFSVDTTPPSVPQLRPVPAYTKGTGNWDAPQLSVSFPSSSDNRYGWTEIKYSLEYTKDPQFGTYYASNWHTSTTQEVTIGIGADGRDDIVGNADDIVNDGTYYMRVKATDKIGNISAYSPVVSTILDTTKPSLTNITATNPRFSPNADGNKDTSIIFYAWTDTNAEKAKLLIYSDANRTNLVRTIEQPLTGQSGSGTLTFDGKDQNGVSLTDNSYVAYVQVLDKAGNITESTSQVMIIDRVGASIVISSPINGYWTNQSSIAVNGQVSGSDTASLSMNSEQVQLDSLGFFSHNRELNPGANVISLQSTDTSGNISSKSITVRMDPYPPIVRSITPSTATNINKPVITIGVMDASTSVTMSRTTTGTNPRNNKVWITYNENGTEITKELIKDGVRLDSALTGNLTCSTSSCTLPFLASLPDRTYTVHAVISDNAGNISEEYTQQFTIDTRVDLEIEKPADNSVVASRSTVLKGKASKESVLTINNVSLQKSKSFTLNDSLNGTGLDYDLIKSNFIVACGEVKNGEPLCSFDVQVAQAVSDANVDTENTITISTADAVGNTATQTRKTIANLFKVNMQIASSLLYMSPNNDGHQDTVTLTHLVTAGDEASLPVITSSKVRINSSTGLVKEYTYANSLPPFTEWDGKDANGNTVGDGTYTYDVSITTDQGATIATASKEIYLRTNLTDSVTIAVPLTGTVTRDGVITVQGQAPRKIQNANGFQGAEKVLVDICVNTLGNQVECDSTATVEETDGFYSSLIVLPRNPGQKTEHVITAKARDEYGNATSISNAVTIIQDQSAIFTDATITPTLTGINSQQDYQDFLDGKISIDKLKKLVLRANVSENTEGLEYAFANYVNVTTRPDQPDYRYIATVNSEKETNTAINYLNLDSVKKNQNVGLSELSAPDKRCTTATGCMWEYYLPVGSDWAGIYEVEFKAKKGEKIETLTSGFKVDGTVPLAPLFLSTEKREGDNWKSMSAFDGVYYSNNESVRFRGAADPETRLNVILNGQKVKEITSTTNGVFEFDLVIPKNESANAVVDLEAVRQDSNGTVTNTIKSANPVSVRYDITPPAATEVVRSTKNQSYLTPIKDGWLKSGEPASYSLKANEPLIYADLVREDSFVQVMSNNAGTWTGSINVERDAEGYYNPEARIIDRAGNVSKYQASNYSNYNLGDFRLYVDNTTTVNPILDKSGWAIDNGIKADGVLPEDDRTTDYYVTRNASATIKGKAERGTKIRIRVESKAFNGELPLVEVSNNNCSPSEIGDKTSSDGLVVREADLCEWSYTYNFTDDGASEENGIPVTQYTFFISTVDNAGNMSFVRPEDQLVIGHDTTSPMLTAVNFPFMTRELSAPITYFGERLVDIETKVTNPKGTVLLNDVIQNTNERTSVKSVPFGSQSDEREGCVIMIDGRRVGNCEDGMYTVSYRAYDSSGNANGEQSVKLERDTVAPATPIVSLYASGGALFAKITGEKGVYAKSQTGGQSITLVNGTADLFLSYIQCGSITYTHSFNLTDFAGNISNSASASFTSAPCPPPPPTGGSYGGETGSINYAFMYPFTDIENQELPDQQTQSYTEKIKVAMEYYMAWSKYEMYNNPMGQPFMSAAYMIAGLFVGAGQTMYQDAKGIIETVYNLFMNRDEILNQLKELWDGLKAIYNDPSLMLGILATKADEFLSKNSLYDMEFMLGQMLGAFIPEIIYSVVSAGVVTAIKSSGFVAKALSSIRGSINAMKSARVLGQSIEYIVDGVQFTIKYVNSTKATLTNLYDGIKHLAHSSFLKVVNKLVKNPIQRAFLITMKGGIDPSMVMYNFIDGDSSFSYVNNVWKQVRNNGEVIDFEAQNYAVNGSDAQRYANLLRQQEIDLTVKHVNSMTDAEAVAKGIVDPDDVIASPRPTWRQSEIDVKAKMYGDGYMPQQSFKGQNSVKAYESGSVRPDLYKPGNPGHSVEVKNYNISTPERRSNLVSVIKKQYEQRLANLPAGTKQTVVIDVRGQNYTTQMLIDLKNSVSVATNNGIEVKIFEF